MKILNKNNILLSVKNYKKQTTSFQEKSYLMILICLFFFPDSLQKFYDAWSSAYLILSSYLLILLRI